MFVIYLCIVKIVIGRLVGDVWYRVSFSIAQRAFGLLHGGFFSTDLGGHPPASRQSRSSSTKTITLTT